MTFPPLLKISQPGPFVLRPHSSPRLHTSTGNLPPARAVARVLLVMIAGACPSTGTDAHNPAIDFKKPRRDKYCFISPPLEVFVSMNCESPRICHSEGIPVSSSFHPFPHQHTP